LSGQIALQSKENGDTMIVHPSGAFAHNGKVKHARPALSKYEQQMRALEFAVELLIARSSMAEYWPEGFQDAGKLLTAVPLPTADFASANRRLANAAGYCRQEEFGAAAFELRALRGLLQRL